MDSERVDRVIRLANELVAMLDIGYVVRTFVQVEQAGDPLTDVEKLAIMNVLMERCKQFAPPPGATPSPGVGGNRPGRPGGRRRWGDDE
jgi:hypothetical protein